MLVALLLGFSTAAGAQEKTSPPRPAGMGYVFLAMGSCQHAVALGGAGGGAEAFITSRLALGGDLGGYSFTDTTTFGVGAVNATIHLGDQTRRRGADPFFTGGWAMTFAPGGFYGRGVNVGGGLNYWIRDRVGLRPEVRGYVIGEEFALILRVGLSFR
jgi:hypothetical protein